MKSSSTKSYVSIVSFFVHWKSIFFLPTFKEFGVISIYKYASTTLLKSKTFALQYLSQKSSKLSQKPLFESLFLWVFVAIFGCGNIFDQRLLFDHKQLCIWPLELSEHYEPRNQSKNQRLKPLRNRLTVSRAKFDVRDFWRCITKFYHKSVAIWCTVYVCELYLNKTLGYTALMGVPPRYRPMFVISST